MYGQPTLIGSDVPSREEFLTVGGGLAVGALLLNLAIVGAIGYGIYRLVRR